MHCVFRVEVRGVCYVSCVYVCVLCLGLVDLSRVRTVIESCPSTQLVQLLSTVVNTALPRLVDMCPHTHWGEMGQHWPITLPSVLYVPRLPNGPGGILRGRLGLGSVVLVPEIRRSIESHPSQDVEY